MKINKDIKIYLIKKCFYIPKFIFLFENMEEVHEIKSLKKTKKSFTQKMDELRKIQADLKERKKENISK